MLERGPMPPPLGSARHAGSAARAGAAALLVAALLAGAAARRPGPAPHGDFVLAGVHPQAAGQPTARGRTLVALAAWRGALYAGYGDDRRNTGPITLAAWEPAARAFRARGASRTEAVHVFRAIGEALYAPAIDPRGRPQADYAAGEPWRDHDPVGATHVYDVATLTGRDLWLAGQEGVDAVAWRRAEAGTPWREALRLPPAASAGFRLARFHFAGVLDGRLHLQAWDASGPRRGSHVFDGSAWADGPDLLPVPDALGWRPTPFGGRLVYLAWPPAFRERAGPLLVFDGSRARPLPGPAVHDFLADGPVLYVLTEAGAVLATRDLAAWAAVATAPPDARSLGRLGDHLYAGSTDARLYRLVRPLPGP
jgi:hypothetical protein